MQVALQEVRRLQQFGVTAGELERYREALLRDSAQLAEQADSVPSLENLDFVMESLALGHTIMDHRKGHEVIEAVRHLSCPCVAAWSLCVTILWFERCRLGSKCSCACTKTSSSRCCIRWPALP